MNSETIFIIIWVTSIFLCASFFIYKLERHRQKITKQLEDGTIPSLAKYKKTIGKHNGVEQNISFAKTADFVNLDSVFKDANLNLRFYLAMPSFLVGLGVLGTFIGFSMTLWSIETILDSTDPSLGMKHLFASVKAAFFTSVAGMFCSLVFSKYEKWTFNDIERKTQDICIRLDAKLYKAHDEFVRESLFALTNNLEQAFREGIKSSFEAIKDELSDLLKAPTDALKRQSDVLGKQLLAWEKLLGEQMQTIQQYTNKVDDMLINIEQDFREGIKFSFEGINNDIKALLKAPTNELKEQSEALGRQLLVWEKSLGNQMQTMQSATEKVESMLVLIDKRVTFIDSHIQSIDREAQAYVQQWTNAFKEQAAALEQQEKSIDNIRQSLADIPVMFAKLYDTPHISDHALR